MIQVGCPIDYVKYQQANCYLEYVVSHDRFIIRNIFTLHHCTTYLSERKPSTTAEVLTLSHLWMCILISIVCLCSNFCITVVLMRYYLNEGAYWFI